MSEDDKSLDDGQKPSAQEGGEDNQKKSGSDAELESILNALDNSADDDKKSAPEKTGGDQGDDKKDYFKKVGNDVFKTEEEYDAWATKNFGEAKRLSGEIKILEDKLKSNIAPQEKKQTELDITSLRWQIKAEDFFEKYPVANNYREEMAAFLRAGKANDENGRPSFKIALAKSLRADGKDLSSEENAPDNKDNIKKIMQSGGGNSGRMSEGSYNSNDELKDNQDFANKALFKM